MKAVRCFLLPASCRPKAVTSNSPVRRKRTSVKACGSRLTSRKLEWFVSVELCYV